MSRFFRQGDDSDSDSSSSEEEELMSGSEDEKPSRQTGAGGKPLGMARFLKRTDGGASDSSSDSDSDSEDESDDDDESEDEDGAKVTIKSAKDKRLDEMEAVGKTMDNAIKINDWVAITTEFDKLVRLVERQTIFEERVPAFYIRTLVSLEASLNAALSKEKDAKESDKGGKKKLNTANSRALNTMKQRVRKSSKEYEEEIKLLNTDPEEFEKKYGVQEVVQAQPASKKKKSKADDAAEDAVPDDEFTTVGKGGKAMQFTPESIFPNLQTIHEARGRKNTDRAEQIKILEKLLEVAVTVYQRIRILLALISARFEYNSSTHLHMTTELWLSAQREVELLISILTSNPQYVVEEQTPDYNESIERNPETEGGLVRVRGSIITFVDRLDEEFNKSLQNLDPHGTDYIERLTDEKVLYQTICIAEGYYENSKQEDPLSRVIMRRLEHIYSKPDAVIQALELPLANTTSPPSILLSKLETSKALIQELSTLLYKSGNIILKYRAMLCHSYHHALHNDIHTARDILLMSHLQEMIHSADVPTQILYNRTLVQIGLCAFRVGLIKDAQVTLQEIYGTQRVKEILAQGLHQQRHQQLTPEQEKAEKQRQLPFHMHINTELLEAAFLVCSMLVEIPLLASIESEEQKRKVVSKSFRRYLDFADRQVFTGPPESTRDHIMQASKALQEGDWERCRNLVHSIKIWSLMPEAKEVKEMLASRIQEAALRTYLFTYGPHYSTLSLSMLSQTFSLSVKEVTAIVSRMIWNEELTTTSLDQSAGVIVFHHVELSRLQQLAQTLAERVGTLVDQNEKVLDQKQGSGAWGDRADGGKGGRKEGEQTQERNRRSDRARGGAARGSRGGRGARFAQGLGNRMTSVRT